jgi:uridine phosphorylase
MLKRRRYPILEFDPSRRALLEPRVSRSHRNDQGLSSYVVLCFFQDVISTVVRKHRAKRVAYLKSEMGKNPIYEIKAGKKRVAVLHPGVGSALAAGFMEEAIAMGGRKIIACGGAGVLRKDLALGHLIVPTSAVRDEGASYHYLPPSREVRPHSQAVSAIRKTLHAHGFPFVTGKTWTTDGFFRETYGKVKLRREEGCLSVEMECAAFFAVGKFRKVKFAQILYGGDDLSGEIHDYRNWDKQVSIRERVFWLAVEACARL